MATSAFAVPNLPEAGLWVAVSLSGAAIDHVRACALNGQEALLLACDLSLAARTLPEEQPPVRLSFGLMLKRSQLTSARRGDVP